ncbi:MAG: metallophosphoesterase [Verrucomicrobiota bacterium]|nr:metallophosphoesterase [Verrucomicrobiota bacterium]
MSFILIIIGLMLALNVTWWWLSARLAGAKAWRHVITAFISVQLIGLGWIISGRLLRTNWDRWLPKFAASAVFIWHFIGLGVLILLGAALLPIFFVRTIMRWRLRDRKPAAVQCANPKGIWTRREFVGFAAAVAPPLFTFSLAGIAMSQLNQFRVRRFVVPVSRLPRDLEGLTLAHVSDMHVGRFTSGRVLREMVGAVNQLRADLVLLTGDLINDSLAALDDGLELVRALDPRFGLYLIEGNHDLIENGLEFERRVKASGIPFLLDESAIVSVRGSTIQLLGLSWTRARERRDEAIALSVGKLLQQRHADVFPILLAHHPHAFDAAAEAGMPLTLSGHTHGGQLMLNEQCGFGPALFRYWSGLYTRGESKLIVSNGVGNWFPLRANAPAEIIHVTLRAL